MTHHFNHWGDLGAKLLHPTQVAIIECIAYMGYSEGRPVSPQQLTRLLGDDIALSSMAYHVRALVSNGVLELRATQPVRGAVEHFYGFAAWAS